MFLIISASPNTDGLTASCVSAALTGFLEATVDAQHMNLCKLQLNQCLQCNNGWGTCLEQHTCSQDDQFSIFQQAVAESEGLIIITPVYWGDMAESAKCAFDRLRRCETRSGDNGILVNKPVIAVAAAGGTGRGISSCLSTLERLIQHMRGDIADLIGVTQWNRAYRMATIQSAATALVKAQQ
ncbi:MAG TPA: NAD(P)H-dependent oxidoreductase [Armatimonadota bacterium]|nr:NAD(P)H-dependent oxidoreductase [Armatimonadota bacterium]